MVYICSSIVGIFVLNIRIIFIFFMSFIFDDHKIESMNGENPLLVTDQLVRYPKLLVRNQNSRK